VWAETSECAHKIAAAVTQGLEVRGVYEGEVGGADVRGYLRYPGSLVRNSPVGITDVLVVALCTGATSEHLEEARKYINNRRAIPVKVVVGPELGGLAAEFEAEHLECEVLLAEATRLSFVKRARNLEDTLRGAFNKIDLNGNGFLSADELVSASATLGHTLNSEEAKLVANAISPDGNIPFNKFKAWWVQGKGDFNTFRRMVQIEMQVNKLVKKGSAAFSSYLEKVEKESNVESTDYSGKLDVGPTEDFANGISFDVDFNAGNDFTSTVSALPDYFRVNPFTYSMELNLLNPEMAPVIVQALEGLKAMVMEMPKIGDAFHAGLDVHFRHFDTRMCVDFTVGGLLAEMAIGQIGVNLETLSFAGVCSAQVISGLRVPDLLSATLHDLILELTSLKIQSHSDFSNVRVLCNALYHAFMQSPLEPIRAVALVVRFLGAIRQVGLELKYDRRELAELVKSGVFKEGEFEQVTERLAGQQAMVPMMLEQVKPMVVGTLEQMGLTPVLQALSLDRITIVSSIPNMRTFYKMSVNFPGLTDLVQERLFK